MYSKTVMPVELPKDGKCYFLKNGFVYWASESHWDKDKAKKKTVDNRVCIGKKVPEKDGALPQHQVFHSLRFSGRFSKDSLLTICKKRQISHPYELWGLLRSKGKCAALRLS